MTYYKKMIITYKKLFVMSFVIMAAVTVSNLLIPCGMRFLVDRISQANNLGQKELLFLLAAFAAFLSCMGFNTWMEIRWYLLLDKLGGLCMRDLTLKMEAALAAASLSDADKIGAEVLKHTMYADVLDVFRVTGHHIPSFISAVLTTIVCMVLAFAFSIKFAVFLVFSVGLGWYVSFLGRKRISQKAGKTNQKMKQCHAVCNQYIDSMTLVQTNDVLDYFQQETTRKLSNFIQTAKKEDRLMLFWSKLSEHYNTISTMLLSVLLLIPSWGGSIIIFAFYVQEKSQEKSHEIILFKKQSVYKFFIAKTPRLRSIPFGAVFLSFLYCGSCIDTCWSFVLCCDWLWKIYLSFRKTNTYSTLSCSYRTHTAQHTNPTRQCYQPLRLHWPSTLNLFPFPLLSAV